MIHIKSKKIEFSKIGSFILFIVGIGTVVAYFWAIFLGFQPDAAVPVAGITEILGGMLGYFMYQAKLKDSRNKYGIDKNGIPYNTNNNSEETSDGMDN